MVSNLINALNFTNTDVQMLVANLSSRVTTLINASTKATIRRSI